MDFIKQATADLGPGPQGKMSVRYSAQQLQTMITSAQQGGDQVEGLLAAILEAEARCNGFYNIYPFSVAAGKQQQILTNNDSRVGMIVSINTIVTTPVVGIYLGQGDISPVDAQQDIWNRCIFMDSSLQTVMQFNVAPTNFVTISAYNGDNIQGVIFEAV